MSQEDRGFMQLSIIIPTFKEAENLGVLLPRLAKTLSSHRLTAEIIVVDDDSQDGTEAVCGGMNFEDEGISLNLITRIDERGLSSAVIRGMESATGSVLVCMDADLSHPVETVPDLYNSIARTDQPAEFVIGSRYTRGGSTAEDWGLGRWVNSKVATWLALPLTRVNDPMAGFFGLARSTFDTADAAGLSPIGYKIGLELIVKAGVSKVEEVPIHFQDRLHGESKLSLKEQLNYVRHLGRLYRHRFPGLVRFALFGAVGSTGVVVDLSVLAVGLSCGLSSSVAAVLAIWLAMSWNFVLNRQWTFAGIEAKPDSNISDENYSFDENSSEASQPEWVLPQYINFCLGCLTGAVVNWTVRVGLLASALAFTDRPYLASIAGILSGLAFNYTICSRLVFRNRHAAAGNNSHEPVDTTVVDDDQSAVAGPSQAEPLVAAESSNSNSRHLDGKGVPMTQYPTRTATALRIGLFLAVVLGASWVFAFLGPTTPAERKAVPDPQRKVDPNADPVSNSPTQKGEQIKGRGAGTRLDISSAAVIRRLRTDTTYLASDDLEGRGARTSGLDLAAQYIALEYEKAALDTSHYNNTPFQQFRLYSRGTEGAVQSLRFIADGDETTLELQENYTSILAAKTGRFDTGVVFVGFGITAPEADYDDYANMDVQGKCVVVLRHAPSKFSGEDTKDLQQHLYIRTKINNAKKHGAIAVIFCSDFSEIARTHKIAGNDRIDEPLLKVELTSPSKDGTPTVHCHRSYVRAFLAKADLDLDAVEQQITKTNKPASQLLAKLSVQGSVARIRQGQKLKNVVGLLPGKGPLAEKTIVLGAHYDHLGKGGWGSLSTGANNSIHNGADDNASGTSILLEVARQLAARNTPLKRNVLFLAFSGEELGLIGSKRYVHDPLIPIKDTVAMLNLDMVGRLRKQKLTVYGTGTSLVWPELLRANSAPNKLEISPRQGGYGPSDHASFYEKGIPVLHFFTGFHPQYHRPSDDIDLLNFAGMQQITSMVVGIIQDVADAPERPRRSVAADNAAEGDNITLNQVLGKGNAPRNALLGIVPQEKNGTLVIAQIVRGSGADRAGIKIADELLKFDDTTLKTQKQLIEIVRAKKPGDKVTIQLKRNGILLELDVTL